MGFYLLFLISCFVLGLAWPTTAPRRLIWFVVGMAVLLSVAVFGFDIS